MDIKPANIGYNLVPFHLKWIDIDCVICETPGYIDPYTLSYTNVANEIPAEILVAREYYKVGLSIYEMLTGKNRLVEVNDNLNEDTPIEINLIKYTEYFKEQMANIPIVTSNSNLQNKLRCFLSHLI